MYKTNFLVRSEHLVIYEKCIMNITHCAEWMGNMISKMQQWRALSPKYSRKDAEGWDKPYDKLNIKLPILDSE